MNAATTYRTPVVRLPRHRFFEEWQTEGRFILWYLDRAAAKRARKASLPSASNYSRANLP